MIRLNVLQRTQMLKDLAIERLVSKKNIIPTEILSTYTLETLEKYYVHIFNRNQLVEAKNIAKEMYRIIKEG